MAGKNGWWCCCGCWYFLDEFKREDSTDCGGAWNEVRGDWGIVGWTLVERFA